MKLEALSQENLVAMCRAGEEILECYRVLGKANANTVGEILRGQGEFVEWDHYPKGDVYDGETFSQYYYHAHRDERGEHGHFHVFLRRGGMPAGVDPVPNEGTEEWPTGSDEICHLIAISMDDYGFPIRLFTTNRWVTGETWYTANDAISMLDKFLVDHTWPSWATNRWISSLVHLYRPQIAALLIERDATLESWRKAHPDGDSLEDRGMEVMSSLEISVEDQLKAIRRLID